MIQQPKKPDRPSAEFNDRLRDRLKGGDPAGDSAFDAQELAVLRREIVGRAREATDRKISSWSLGLRSAATAALVVVAALVAFALRPDSRDQHSQAATVREIESRAVTNEPTERVTSRAVTDTESEQATSPIRSTADLSATDSGAVEASAPQPVPEPSTGSDPKETATEPSRLAEASRPIEPGAASAAAASATQATPTTRQIRFRGPNGTQVIWSLATERSR